ncbi:MAG: GNAT family N-acetyltransferase [Brachybacterium sp.]|nr:GNAT family N-acetyltransferase [Brachybacterium sp.]
MPTLPSPWSLRDVRASDAAAILEAFRSAPDMERQGDVTDQDSAAAYCAWLRGEDRHSVALVDADDTLRGIVAVAVDEQNRTGWFFYWLHAGHRRQGLAARAAATVADHALAPSDVGGWGLERLELGHRANNPASGSVARAGGFMVEGREREKFLIGGTRHDVLTYGRIRSDPPATAQHLPWSHA